MVLVRVFFVDAPLLIGDASYDTSLIRCGPGMGWEIFIYVFCRASFDTFERRNDLDALTYAQ